MAREAGCSEVVGEREVSFNSTQQELPVVQGGFGDLGSGERITHQCEWAEVEVLVDRNDLTVRTIKNRAIGTTAIVAEPDVSA